MDDAIARSPESRTDGHQRTLPGFAAFLRPHAQPQVPSAARDSDVRDCKHERRHGEQQKQQHRSPSYASSAFSAAIHSAADRYETYHHQPHPQHHGYGPHSLRAPVVTPAPLLYAMSSATAMTSATAVSSATATTTHSYSPHATFKVRKLDVHDSPSASARRSGSARSVSSSSSSSSPRRLLSHDSLLPPPPHQLRQPPPTARASVVRTSRYLREVDRRTILQRIQNGEKQADLAKEYQVSRAAISNLKQRRRLKETQQRATVGPTGALGRPRFQPTVGGDHDNDDDDRDEEDDHEEDDDEEEQGVVVPAGRRRRRRSSDEDSSSSEPLAHDDDAAVRAVAALRLARQEPADANAASPSAAINRPDGSSWRTTDCSSLQVNVRLVDAVSTAHVVAQLRQSDVVSLASFRLTTQRLARLLLEETLSRVRTRPVCAIAVDDGRSRSHELLLDEFRAIEPTCGVGAVRIQLQGPLRSTTVRTTLVHAPEELSRANVLLLVLVCSETGDEICAAVEALRAQGVDVAHVTVVALVGYASGFARVHDAFPELGDVLTAHVAQSSTTDASDDVDVPRLLLRRMQQTHSDADE